MNCLMAPLHRLMHRGFVRWLLTIFLALLACAELHSSRAADPAEDPFGGTPTEYSKQLNEKRLEQEKKWAMRMENRRLIKIFFKQGEPSQENPKPNDAYAVESLLGQLHALRYDSKRVREPGELLWSEQKLDLLTALVQQPWQLMPGETVDAFTSRISGSAGNPSLVHQEIEALAKTYGEVADTITSPWPYNWREKEEVWLALLKTILSAQQSNQPAQVFHDRMPEDPTDAQWYRLAYLRCYRARPQGDFDLELVKPLLETKTPHVLLGRLCDILVSMPLPHKNDAERETYEALQTQLTALLGEVKDDDRRIAGRLGLFSRHGAKLLPPIEHWLKHSASVDAGSYFAHAAQVSIKTEPGLMLGREVEVKFREMPLGEVMREMGSLVRCPFWIDDKVYTDRQIVNLTAQGPWLEVLDRILATTNYRASLLWSRILWIGPPAELPKVEQLAGRIPLEAEKIRKTLFVPAACEFVETPLSDVIEYLKDAHEVEIFCMEKSDLPISLNARNLPLLALLSICTKRANWEWQATEELIVAGPPEKMAAYRRDIDRQLRRATFCAGKLHEALSAPVQVEFVETPLRDVANYLAKTYHLNIEVIGTEDKPVTQNLKNISLSTVLSLMAVSHDLAWDCDGEKVIIGESISMEAHLRIVADRKARGNSLPQDDLEKLAQVMTIEFENTPLKEVIASLADSTTLPIVTGENLDLKQPITMHNQSVSLEMQLYMLSLKHKLKWEYRDGKIFISKP